MLFSRAIDAFFASRVKESGSNLNAQRNVAAALPMLQDLSVLCHNITRYMKVSVIQHSDVSSATYLQRISPETSCRSHPNQRRLYKISAESKRLDRCLILNQGSIIELTSPSNRH